MPIYEYVCVRCGRRFRKLVGVIAQTAPLQCPHCASDALNRQMSRFARGRNEDDVLDAMADEMEAAGEDNPQAMKRIMREMGQEMGEDLEEDFEAAMEEEAGGAGDFTGDD